MKNNQIIFDMEVDGLMKNDVYFDIIPLTLPSMHNEEEFKNSMAKGIYNWLFDKDLKKKVGHVIPGHDGLLYNYVNPADGDYMLNIQINKDIMKINLNHIDKSKNCYDFAFFPSTHFKMMMNWCHFKNSFSFSKLKIANLHHNR